VKPIFVGALLAAVAAPAFAQSEPQSIPSVIAICAPVIDEEYKGDDSRWGTCIKATSDFLTFTYGPPPQAQDPNAVTADLIVELAKLYRPLDCPDHPTELPDAIRTAVSFTTDPDQKQLIEGIADNMANCAAIETASIGEGNPVSPN
jgi:hypothetical protein